MTKNVSFLGSLLLVMMLCSCSNGKEVVEKIEDTTGKVSFSLNFSDVSNMFSTRAAVKSTAVPTTSWDSIKSLEVLLYDENGVIKYANLSTNLPATDGQNQKKYTYTDVPVGKYTLVVVGNTNLDDRITTNIGSVAQLWNSFNVRQKDVSTLALTHKPGEFPEFLKKSMVDNNKKAFVEPAEIFIGKAAGVVEIKSSEVTNVPAFSLKREVSLMRIRLNVKDTEAGVVNENVANGVDFTQNASIMIHRLPKDFSVKADNTGGVNKLSEKDNILSIAGDDIFKTVDPTTGYNPTKVLSGNFSMWRDIVVFPNNDGRADDNSNVLAKADRIYQVVISGLGKAGHVLANGTKLQEDTTIYWSGLVKEKFLPNQIREVNLTLKSGGTTEVIVDPKEEGGLIINLGNPEPWDSNIVVSEIIL